MLNSRQYKKILRSKEKAIIIEKEESEWGMGWHTKKKKMIKQDQLMRDGERHKRKPGEPIRGHGDFI